MNKTRQERKICVFCKRKHKYPTKSVYRDNVRMVRMASNGETGMVYMPKCAIGKRVRIEVLRGNKR